jgi:type IV pilus assembly protein PilV
VSAKRRRSGAAIRGYTFIEVMMALGLLGVGAAGIVAMQKAAILGNAGARAVSTGTAIANRWAERLRADAMLWNTTTPLSDIGDTRFLKDALGNPTPPDGPMTWTLPVAIPDQVSPEADPLGADIVSDTDASPVAYCTHISYRRMHTPPATDANPLPVPTMISAVIRVSWRRDWNPMDCGAPDMFAATLDPRYGAVYLTTGVTPQERP